MCSLCRAGNILFTRQFTNSFHVSQCDFFRLHVLGIICEPTKKCGNCTHARAFRLSQWPIRKRKRPESFFWVCENTADPISSATILIFAFCEYLAKPQVSVPFFPSYSINFHCHIVDFVSSIPRKERKFVA